MLSLSMGMETQARTKATLLDLSDSFHYRGSSSFELSVYWEFRPENTVARKSALGFYVKAAFQRSYLTGLMFFVGRTQRN